MEKEIIALLAGIVVFISYLKYIYSMWWGSTRPSRSSWWILTIVWGVILISSQSIITSNADHFVEMTSRWLAWASIIGSLFIAVSTIWRGSTKKEENWTRGDYYSAASAGLALILYFVFHKPEISFIFAILADFSGLFPTIQNAKDFPEQEDIIAWSITVVGCTLGVIAVSDWSFSLQSASNWAIPVYLIIVDLIIVFFIGRGLLRRKLLNSAK